MRKQNDRKNDMQELSCVELSLMNNQRAKIDKVLGNVKCYLIHIYHNLNAESRQRATESMGKRMKRKNKSGKK